MVGADCVVDDGVCVEKTGVGAVAADGHEDGGGRGVEDDICTDYQRRGERRG